MKLGKDKLMHALSGTLAALAGAAMGAALHAAQGFPAALGAASGAIVGTTMAGLTKEVADYQDNKLQPAMHGVELLDALATAAPGWLLAGLILWAGRMLA